MAGTRELSVEVVSRYGGTAWEGRAYSVTVPLVDGVLGVLPGRQPVLALLGRGPVRVSDQAGQVLAEVQVAGGFCSVDQDVVTVAADRVGEEIHGDDSDIDLTHETVVHVSDGALD